MDQQEKVKATKGDTGLVSEQKVNKGMQVKRQKYMLYQANRAKVGAGVHNEYTISEQDSEKMQLVKALKR
jgi:uncharacterized protein YaiE (UPF0345 family)